MSEAVSRARLWISGNPCGLKVSNVREGERRIDVTSQKGSFFVTVPTSTNDQDEWVWLSNEDHTSISLTGCFYRLFGVMRRIA